MISSVSTRNYLFKVSNWNTRIRRGNCSRSRMKTLEQCQWRRSSVYVVKCKHISNFLLIIDFEQAKVCWIYIEKINTFEDKIRYIMRLCCSNLSVTKIYLQIAFEVITLGVNQWEIFTKEFTSDVDSG